MSRARVIIGRAHDGRRDGVVTHREEVALLRANAHVPRASGFVDDDGASHPITVCAASHPGIGAVPWPCETSRWVVLYDELLDATLKLVVDDALGASNR